MKQQELCHGGAFGNALIIMHISLVIGENVGNSHPFGAKWHRIGAFDQRRRGSPSVPGASAEKNLGDRLPHLAPMGSPGSVPTTAIFPIPPAGKTGTKYPRPWLGTRHSPDTQPRREQSLPHHGLVPFPLPTRSHAGSRVSPPWLGTLPPPDTQPRREHSPHRLRSERPPFQRAEQTVWAVRTTKHDAGCRMPDAGCRMPDAGCRMKECCPEVVEERG